MTQYIVRFAKRFAVLIPGLVIAYVSVNNIYPVLNRRAPAVIAFLITYILAAYILIPAAIRLVRLFIKPRHLPVYSVTPDGFASDPVNIGVIGTRRQLETAMHNAGWDIADKHSLFNVYKEVISSLTGQVYRTAPMSSLYLLGRKQDIGFEIQIEDRLWHRHHVRFWATPLTKRGKLRAKDIQWFRPTEQRQHRKRSDETLLWLGAASRDVGLALIRHNAQLTHMIHPDTNHERDLIVDQLEIDGAELIATLQIQKPYTLANRALSGYLQTDGQLKIVGLPGARTAKPTKRQQTRRPTGRRSRRRIRGN